MGKAVKDVRVTVREVTVQQSPSWYPQYIAVSTNKALVTSQLAERPDTIYNPKDSHGFRKMSPWNRTWLQIAAPVYSYSTKVKPGRQAWFKRNSTSSALDTFLDRGSDFVTQWSNLLRIKPPAVTQLSCENQARTRVLNRVSQKKWDLGVTALELRETSKLAASLAGDVAKAWKRLSPESFRGGRLLDKILDSPKQMKNLPKRETDILERFADRWMEYTFGIKPTLYDLSDASDYLSSQIGSPLVAFAKAGASKEDRTRFHTEPANSEHRVVLDAVSKYSVHYVLLYKSSTEGVSPLTELGLDNPYSVAWEVLPYSWMVDYVLGIGDWLSSWTAVNGLILESGCRSVVWRSHCEVMGVQNLNPDTDWDIVPRPVVDFRGGEFSRELLSSFPTPAFAPSLKSSVGGFQLANSLFALRHLAR